MRPRLHQSILSSLLALQVLVVVGLFTNTLPAVDVPFAGFKLNGWDLRSLGDVIILEAEGSDENTDVPTTVTIKTAKWLDVQGHFKFSGGSPSPGEVITAVDTQGYAQWQAPAAGTVYTGTDPIDVTGTVIDFNIEPLTNVTNPSTSDTVSVRRMSDGANVEVQLGHLPGGGGGGGSLPSLDDGVIPHYDSGTLVGETDYVVYDPVNGRVGINVPDGAPDATIHAYDADEAPGLKLESPQSNDTDLQYTAGSEASNSSVGTVAWTSLSNLQADDAAYAQIALFFRSTTSHYLQSENIPFSRFGIPSDATIVGIEVEAELYYVPLSGAVPTDNRARIVKNGTIGSTDKAAGGVWPTSPTVRSYGGAADLWGETWSPSDTVGFALSANSSGGSLTSCNPRVDFYRFTVGWYTVEEAALYDQTGVHRSSTVTQTWGAYNDDSGFMIFEADAVRALGLTGATSDVRFVGGNSSGAPTSGTFETGDVAINTNGFAYVCTAGGSPGTWRRMGAPLRGIYHRTAASTIAHNTPTAIDWTHETTDELSHDTGTNPHRITAPAAGFMRVSVSHFWVAAGAATGRRTIQIRDSSSGIIRARQKAGSTEIISSDISNWFPISSGDWFQIVIVQTSGGNLDSNPLSAYGVSIDVEFYPLS